MIRALAIKLIPVSVPKIGWVMPYKLHITKLAVCKHNHLPDQDNDDLPDVTELASVNDEGLAK